MQHIFGLPVTGLLKYNQVYSNYWNYHLEGTPYVDIIRSPHIAQEHSPAKVVTSGEMEKWFAYQKTGIIVAVFGNTIALKLNSADFDGDHVLTVDNPVICEAAMKQFSNTVYHEKIEYPYAGKKKSNKVIVSDLKKIIDCDYKGYKNNIGNVINPISILWSIGQLKEVQDYIKIMSIVGSITIDYAKHGEEANIPKCILELLKRHKKITSSNNRGKMAFASGSMNTGSSSGNGKFYGDSSSSTKKKSTSKKSSKSKKSSSNSSDKKNSKQVIDWIARKLDILQEKIDLTKAKFENLFSVRKQNNNVKKQIGQTIKLLDAQEKAVTKYQKKADSIKLSGSLKEKVRNGAIKGSLSELIKEYGEKTANQINKYQDYIDKVNEAKKAVAGLKAEIKELSRQKLDLKIDDNERKRTYQEAKYANAKTTDAKNKILDKEIETYNSDDRAYNRYYKRAVQSRNKDGKEAKTAVSRVKGLSKKDKNNIKKLIKCCLAN